MKKALILILCVVMVMCIFAACAAQEEAAPAAEEAAEEAAPAAEEAAEATDAGEAGGGKTFTIGYLGWDLSSDWNNSTFAGLEWGAKQKGCEIQKMDASLDAEKQVDQCEQLINSGVDCIVMFPITPDSGATVVKMCNDAGVPIVVENTFLDDSAGDMVGQVACQYGDIGYAAIKWAAENIDDAKLLYVHGGTGEGVYEAYQVGVDQALEDYKDKIECVGLINGEWATEPSYNVTMDYISAGGAEFNVVFANNDAQASGVYSALEENGMADIPIISTGGSNEGYEMLDKGIEAANMTAPANLQGIIAFGMLWSHFNGTKFADNTKVPLPTIPIDSSNKDSWIFWDDMDAGYAYVSENVGEYNP